MERSAQAAPLLANRGTVVQLLSRAECVDKVTVRCHQSTWTAASFSPRTAASMCINFCGAISAMRAGTAFSIAGA